ncbi:kinase-like domain-containing protein [Gigaspora rosea]|uniref:non-specific serine/threonine protein kinase n=1 Tax=Gigaspora rosea TaxID=44941 RepID=A0A397UBD8_9GLOM|nr:kinase-like domain-containing protein [Gigaspora rosea]
MEDYVPMVATSAWKVAPTCHEFRLHLLPHEEKLKEHVSVDLHIKFPKTYPRSPPDIKVENARGLSEEQLNEIKANISRLIKENLGQEMIFNIAEYVQEFITTNNSGINKQSFHEQMLSRNEKITKAEQKKALEEMDRARQNEEQERTAENILLLQKIQEEEQRLMAKLEEEKQKRKQLKVKDVQDSKPLMDTSSVFKTVNFDRKIVLDPGDSSSIPFRSVILGPLVGKGIIGSTYMVQAVNVQIKNMTPKDRHVLILKDIEISEPHYLEPAGKEKLEDIEKELDRVKKLRHSNLVTVYESELERCASGWNLHILMEYAGGGTMVDLLKKCGVVRLQLAREYMKQLLDALDYLHANSFVHRDIKASNILFSEIPGKDDYVAKLADISYHRKLLDMHKEFPFVKFSNEEPCKRWISPEQKSKSNVYSRKNDIWYLGVIFVQMLFGLNAVQRYNSLDDLLNSSDHNIPLAVQDVLKTMLEKDQSKRPTPLELLAKPFFSEGSSSFLDTPLKFIMSTGSVNSSIAVTPQFTKENDELAGSFGEAQHAFSPPKPSQHHAQFSRYKLDFEEITFLGKGGYGEVIKAKNILDGRYYAIKKVRLNPNDIEKTRKILRETETFTEDITGAVDESLDPENYTDDDDFDFFSADASSNRKFIGSSSSSSDSEFEMQEEITRGECVARNKVVPRRSPTKEEKCRILYIQMEYCENKTLKDIIDNGVEEEEGWNDTFLYELTKKYLLTEFSDKSWKGLGMIHRDLKPSNIFLDAKGDVKIGDFGLATTNESDALFDPGTFRMSTFYRMNSREDSMTGDVGTLLYGAPEVATNPVVGTRYNQKGIILFEIFYKFSTEMERRITILNLRRSEIAFPKDFPFEKMNRQVNIIRWCLHHNAKDRPTSIDLLKCEWLPAKIEDDHLQECMRTMANPNSPHYQSLISELFTQSSDKHKDYTYDFGNVSFSASNSLTFGRVRDYIVKIFRHHGAVELNTPLLMPKSDIYEEDKKAVYLIDSDGGIVQLPYDLTVPFSRYISRNNITDLKRYTFDRVYRENITGQPRIVNEADFDIIHSTPAPMVAEAEIIKVVDEVLEEFPPLKTNNYCFLVNHTSIVETIFDWCRIPVEIRRGVYNLLSQLDKKYTMNQIKIQLAEKYDLPRSVLDELVLFDIRGDLNHISTTLEKLIPTAHMRRRIHETISEFTLLLTYTQCLDVRHNITFVPLLTYNNHYYKNGMIFQTVDSSRKDLIAAGGRYDSLIQKFRPPIASGVSVRQQIFAVGVNIAVQKIVIALENYQIAISKMIQKKKLEEERSFGFWAPKKCDVYVASFGKIMLQERLDLVRELWAHNIKADFMYEEPTDLTPEILAVSCRDKGINWIVTMRHKSQDLYTSRDAVTIVKVKNLILKTEEEVPRSELCVKLNSEIQEQMRIDLYASGSKFQKHHLIAQTDHLIHDTSLPMSLEACSNRSKLSIKTFIPSTTNKGNKKVKNKQKQLLIDKAHDNISGMIKHINDGSVSVVAIDVSRELLRKIPDCDVLDDESFKSKILDMVSPPQKEYLSNIQNHLKKLRTMENNKHVWLYSHRDDFGILYQFFS